MTYAEVLELDKRLKSFPLHPEVTNRAGDKSAGDSKTISKQLNLKGSLHPMASLFWKEMGEGQFPLFASAGSLTT